MRKQRKISITLARLTCQRVSDILDQLRKADEQVFMDGWAQLPANWKRILKMRQDMRSHPTRGDVARRLVGYTASMVRSAEERGLNQLIKAFVDAGYVVTVDGVRI